MSGLSSRGSQRGDRDRQCAAMGEARLSRGRRSQSGGGEDVDHLAFGGDGLAHELADRGVDLFGRLPVAAALFAQRGLQGLEITHVITDCRGFIAGGAEGEGAGKFCHHLHPALLAVFLFENVLLTGGNELQALRGGAADPLVPVEAVHQVAGDVVFLQHHGDGLGGVEGRVSLAAAFGVGDQRLLELIGEAEVIHHQTARLVAEPSTRERARQTMRSIGRSLTERRQRGSQHRFTRAMACMRPWPCIGLSAYMVCRQERQSRSATCNARSRSQTGPWHP